MSAVDLKAYALLAELSETERDTVAELLERVELDEGEPIFQEGQEADGLVLVERGSLKLDSSRIGALGSVGPGAVLGGLSLVAVGPREASATAAEESSVQLLTRSAFRRLLDDAPRAACRLLEALLVEVAADVRGELDRIATPDRR